MKDQSPDEKRPEIISYLKEENAYTKEMHLDPNEKLTEEIYKETLSKIKEDDDSVPVFRKPYYYYTRTIKGQQYSIKARKLESMDAKEEILLDLNTFDEEYLDLQSFEASPDHTTIAYSLDTDGSEKYSIYFKDLASGKILESDTISNSGGEFEWYNDNKTILYNVLDETHRSFQVWKHTIGSIGETLIYNEKDKKFSVSPEKSHSGKFMFLHTSSTLTSEVHYMDAAHPADPPKRFLERKLNHLYSVDHQGDRFIIKTNGGGKYLNFSVWSCSINDVTQEKWVEILPYDPLIHIVHCMTFKNYLALYECVSTGYKRIRVLKIEDGKVTSNNCIKFDEPIHIVELGGDSECAFDSSILRFYYDSFLTPPQVWEYDMQTESKTLLKKMDFGHSYDSSKYTMERVHAPISKETSFIDSHGTPIPSSIPISLVYRKDMFKKDGTNPLYLYGYGSYGISIDPSWSPSRFSLLDRGIVFAIAHIRGGGDCGRAWYEAGKFKNKRNTFYDFVACADELVSKKYSSNQIMAIDGRSAGGLLIGATVNLRPDIAYLAIAGVPFVDVTNTMMDDTIPLTINEYEEWGNPNERDFFDYINSYSPYDNLVDGKLPHMLIKAGLNDPRVQYWGTLI